ncbi:MAG: aldolase catalytic domain-containing protein [Oscillospiraceae bacterium]|nr:aldolase catalytic domain-containing protein [Oscillospiraceae bacterium]
MSIRVLDCTLRDGGYCNDWRFEHRNIVKITSGLVAASVDIIECGFLTNKVSYDAERSKYPTLGDIARIIPQDRAGKMFVCMVNYGEYRIEDLPVYDGSSVDGIRVAFHKRDMLDALEFCEAIQKKGYKVFVQAMVSLAYSDEEFLDMIHRVNEFAPYAFYIVDSFGVMRRKDLTRLFYVVEHNLNEAICIGYHAHNNMQLAYSNAQALADIRTKRSLIIDVSVFGMGRGAGNLNTELFLEYLNDNLGANYQLKPLLTIIDEILNVFYQQNYWGYSLPNYLSAKHNAHPNYANYLDAKKTLTVESIDEIFAMMDDDKRIVYDQAYIENLYLQYMEKGHTNESRMSEFAEQVRGKTVLLIAPGKSSREEAENICKKVQQPNVLSISVNFDYAICDTDYIFVSNLRRYKELSSAKKDKCIVTSNIPAQDTYLQVKYQDLLNTHDYARDNAGMMLIKLLIRAGAKKILLAGVDGYSVDPTQNFADQKMNFFTQKATFEAMNAGMNSALQEFATQIDIEFATNPRYLSLPH